MFDSSTDNHKDRLQFLVEAANWRLSQSSGKFGIPLILPRPTPFLLSRLDPNSRETVVSWGPVPLLHLSQTNLATEELSSAIQNNCDIDAAAHGFRIKSHYHAVLYQFYSGDCSMRLVFDAQNRGVNNAFRCWQKQGYIPTVITSPGLVGVADFPCGVAVDESFMDRAAAESDDYTLRKLLERYSEAEEFENTISNVLGDVVLGHSLEQIVQWFGPTLEASLSRCIV